jgi:hypothetical protein
VPLFVFKRFFIKKFGFSLEHNNYNNTTILLTGRETNVKLKKEKL